MTVYIIFNLAIGKNVHVQYLVRAYVTTTIMCRAWYILKTVVYLIPALRKALWCNGHGYTFPGHMVLGPTGEWWYHFAYIVWYDNTTKGNHNLFGTCECITLCSE